MEECEHITNEIKGGMKPKQMRPSLYRLQNLVTPHVQLIYSIIDQTTYFNSSYFMITTRERERQRETERDRDVIHQAKHCCADTLIISTCTKILVQQKHFGKVVIHLRKIVNTSVKRVVKRTSCQINIQNRHCN